VHALIQLQKLDSIPSNGSFARYGAPNLANRLSTLASVRKLARRPAFTLATALILALGISATTTLFSLIDAVLWKPLPYPNPGRMVTVYATNPAKNQNTSLVAPGRIEDWNRLSQSFDGISRPAGRAAIFHGNGHAAADPARTRS